MKATIAVWNGEPYGIDLTAESAPECALLRKFWRDGTKVNAIAHNGTRLQITFGGLIEAERYAQEKEAHG